MFHGVIGKITVARLLLKVEPRCRLHRRLTWRSTAAKDCENSTSASWVWLKYRDRSMARMTCWQAVRCSVVLSVKWRASRQYVEVVVAGWSNLGPDAVHHGMTPAFAASSVVSWCRSTVVRHALTSPPSSSKSSSRAQTPTNLILRFVVWIRCATRCATNSQ